MEKKEIKKSHAGQLCTSIGTEKNKIKKIRQNNSFGLFHFVKKRLERTFVKDALVPKDDGLEGTIVQESIEDVAHRL